jgi:hypothetical protein
VLLDRSIPYKLDRFELAGTRTLTEDGPLSVAGPAKALERAHPLIHSVSNVRLRPVALIRSRQSGVLTPELDEEAFPAVWLLG